ncbi:/ / hypothetical protein / 276340:277128 Reverse [Candidatus Hepatoplasma crinochetorum]|uniref:Uncharacterized protein n=1 Tax=Candidatus Hepatoplasma crinochetorum TaxID=295596 RepID=A0A0G7ZNM3_9MOLU|nr:/ / hypothetical protein / 276340:277128 Reverse [Candidatus Hepatoplasma crinochetorum]
MNHNKIEFFKWIREIEFKNWKNYYIDYFKKIKDENISNWIKENLNLLKDFKNTLTKFKKENFELIKKLENQIDNNKKINLNKDEKEKSKIYELMISINEYLDFINNENYNKVKKHKMIYFMISFAIYKNKSYLGWEKYEDIFKIFLIDEKKENMEWCAFENGPILKNIYRWNKFDKEIYFSNLTNDQFKIFESAYFLLKNYTIPILINKSHETDPWKKVFKEESYYKKIKNEDIIKYFKKNKPFFVNF